MYSTLTYTHTQSEFPTACEYLLAGVNLHRHSGFGTGMHHTRTAILKMWHQQPQITTGVHVVKPPAAAGGSSVARSMGKNEKVFKVLQGKARHWQPKARGTMSEMQSARLATAHARRKESKEQVKSQSNGFWCSLHPGCNRFFRTKAGLEAHQRRGECQSGTQLFRRASSDVPASRVVNRRDHIKRTVHQLTSTICTTNRGDTSVPEYYDGTWNDLPGGPYTVNKVPLGYATKVRRVRVHLSHSQREYLEWCFALGEKEKGLKMGPRVTAKHMALHGTEAGWLHYSASRFASHNPTYWSVKSAPTFRVSELLEHWYIKSWFSSRKAKGNDTDVSVGQMYQGELIHSMGVGRLRDIAKVLGIPSGRKKELRGRICAHIASVGDLFGKTVRVHSHGVVREGTIISRTASTERTGVPWYRVQFDNDEGYQHLHRDEINQTGGPLPCFCN